ncbi:MAG TPA: hypothetical protein PKW75_00545 [candidate division Zixibacteria bacterium]|nr:hypothetical protein [candidate division Zixibacteria bacterium]MDD4917550.1 hypothetical protein [candidate division Zixibacteria bacterium]MDM7972181.1 hypothetical protein [candidate division Zixibacteria bacterium]HOD66477.1 hypothetical protein [candidate division Zixibacteria bacterium]HOZ06749.1 hypothetical protein [candidate division Zixibacteria bacterium]
MSVPRWSYRKSLASLLACLILLQAAAVIVAGPDRPPWGDESHFVDTVRLFASRPSLETLRTYPEMSGPLPFALYAAWGHLAGLGLWNLRLLSLVIALGSYLVFHRLLWRMCGDGRLAFLFALLFALQPYMIGFSIFVFTDGAAILFLLAALWGAVAGRAVLILLGLAGALLCRQYAVFAVMAVAAWALLLRNSPERREFAGRALGAAAAAAVPLLTLFLLWGHVSPDNRLRGLYLGGGLAFHPSALVLYISLLFWYLLPAAAYAGRRVYTRGRLIAAAALSPLYWLFPVEASPAAKAIGVQTVGLLHKAVENFPAAPWLPHAFFFAGFLFGLPIVLHIAQSAVARIRARTGDVVLLLDSGVIAFLLVMPFSYLAWEKYMMPLAPLVLARLAALRVPGDPAS